ncbi:MAG: hypothetical protein SXQ77_04055, partial [Halobacteria archaeon]|nr:hypothetical protein [Halobacteria archaeon]
NWSSIHDWDTASIETVEGDAGNENEDAYDTSFDAQNLGEARAGVVLSPDTSVSSVTQLIESAENSIYVQQAYIHEWDSDEGNGENP